MGNGVKSGQIAVGVFLAFLSFQIFFFDEDVNAFLKRMGKKLILIITATICNKENAVCTLMTGTLGLNRVDNCVSTSPTKF